MHHVARAVAGSDQYRGNRREEASSGVGENDRSPGFDAGGASRARVAANHDDMAPEPGVAQHPLAERGEQEQCRQWPRNRADLALQHIGRCAVDIQAAAAGEPSREPGDQCHRRHADDDRIGPEIADHPTLDSRDDGTEKQRDQQRRQQAEWQRGNENDRAGRQRDAEGKRHDVARQRDEGHANRHAADE